MKITKRQLKRIIREEYTQLKRRGSIRESVLLKESHSMAVDKIVKMLQVLDDPYMDWWQIEDRARDLCKRMGVDFGPAFTEALQVFGIDY